MLTRADVRAIIDAARVRLADRLGHQAGVRAHVGQALRDIEAHLCAQLPDDPQQDDNAAEAADEDEEE